METTPEPKLRDLVIILNDGTDEIFNIHSFTASDPADANTTLIQLHRDYVEEMEGDDDDDPTSYEDFLASNPVIYFSHLTPAELEFFDKLIETQRRTDRIIFPEGSFKPFDPSEIELSRYE